MRFLEVMLLLVIGSRNCAGQNEGDGSPDINNRTTTGNEDRKIFGAIAFSAARTRHLKGNKQTQYSLGFDHVYINEGGYFNPRTGVFTVPIPGVYEFTFTGGALPHKKLSLQLMKNHFEIQTLAFDGHRKRNPHLQNQKILLELDIGERIWIRLAPSRHYGVVGTTRGGHVTTFTGRLLTSQRENSPLTAVDGVRLVDRSGSRRHALLRSKRQVKKIKTYLRDDPIAFSVAKTTSFTGEYSNGTNRYRNGVITYDKYFVNIGAAMDLLSGEFEAPVRGLYFFSFTVGKYPRMKLSVSLVKNDNDFQVMVYDESRSNKRQMQSQSIILHLEEGEKVWLKSYNAPGYAVYSNLGNYITFNGYLLNAL